MRGKNTREKKRSKKLAKIMADDPWPEPPVSSPGSREALWMLTSPRKIASELALFRYGFDIQPYMLDLIYRGTSNVSVL